MDFFSRWLSRISGVMLVTLLLLVALPLGSNRDWAWGPLAIAVAAIAIVQGGSLFRQRYRTGIRYLPLVPAALAFVAVVIWAVLQVETPAFFFADNAIVDQAYSSLGLASPARIALRNDQVATCIMRWLLYALTFWIVIEEAQDDQRARRLLVAIAISGVAITLYGLLAEMAASLKGDLAMLLPKAGDDFSATFVNRNNYATYVGLCALTVIALVRLDLSSSSSSRRGEPFRLKVRRVLLQLGGRLGVYAALLIVLLGGLFLSASRAGLLSFLLGFITIWALGRRRSLIALAVSAVLLGLFMALPGGSEVVERSVALLNGRGGDRAALYALDLQAIMLRPWTGWGVGSFDALYPVLQPPSLVPLFDKAHNTYLELAMDLGIPFGILLPLAILWIVARCAIGVAERSRNREMPALAVSAAVLVGVHSLFDFSVQIPAVAVIFLAILGVGWTQSWSSRRMDSTDRAFPFGRAGSSADDGARVARKNWS